MTGSSNFQLMLMLTGFVPANSAQTLAWLSQVQMIALSSSGMLLREAWSRASMIMKTTSIQSDSTLMGHASLVAALTDQSRSGISAARDFSSTTMLTRMEWTQLLSTLMVASYCLHLMIPPSRSGILDKVTSYTPCMGTKVHQQLSTSLHVVIISAPLELIQ